MGGTSNKQNILVVGAWGQLGSELVQALIQRYGSANVIATDIRKTEDDPGCITEQLDVLNKEQLHTIIENYQVTQVYHLAALLSATGEQNPALAWEVNMNGLMNVLDAVSKYDIEKVFWPSSIAVFGPSTPRISTPQTCIMEPSTMYGITKLAGESLCRYYHSTYGVDVRSLRYPGIISYKNPPGGGTTDYAIDIFYEGIQSNKYTCFLRNDASLPMMYIDDAIRATLELMDAPAEKLSVRSSYNLGALSFTPAELADSIKELLPGFEIHYEPDFRQQIAETWPSSIDYSCASDDWNWKPEYDLQKLTQTMMRGVRSMLNMKV